jgi:hypothetical protein
LKLGWAANRGKQNVIRHNYKIMLYVRYLLLPALLHQVYFTIFTLLTTNTILRFISTFV